MSRDGSPLFYSVHAFVSGGTATGVYQALSRSVRMRTNPSIDGKVFLCAYLMFLGKTCPWSIEAGRFNFNTISAVPYLPLQSSGYFPVEPVIFASDDLEIKFSNFTKQKFAHGLAVEMLLELVDEVKEGIKNKVYDENWFPTFISKVSVKPEVRVAGTDPDKTRIIFIGCMVHLLCDKVLFADFVKSTYQRRSVMIGHQWKKGGATHVARKMGWKRNDVAYCTLDIKHFDQSALAPIISLILLAPFFLLKDDNSEDFKVARAFMLKRAHEMAVKIVKWEGFDYRFIVGQVFSGLFVTSWLDTVYMELAADCCAILCYERLLTINKELARAFQVSFMPRLQYGDNSLYAFETRFVEHVFAGRTKECPLGQYQKDMENYLGLTLKSSETFLYLPKSADPNGVSDESPFFTLIRPSLFNGRVAGFEVIREGPEFLKRRFVRMLSHGRTINLTESGDLDNYYAVEPEIMPWRSERDFFSRISLSTTALENEVDKWRSKYLGLLVDTMGTNKVAYDAVRSVYLQVSGNAVTRQDVVNHASANEKTLEKVLHRTGCFTKRLPDFVKSSDALYEEFVWDERWRNAWAVSGNFSLFDEYGVQVKPLWGEDIPAAQFLAGEFED